VVSTATLPLANVRVITITAKKLLNSLNQVAEELQLLTTNFTLLLKVFESPANEGIFKSNMPQSVTILDILQSISHSCAECAKALDVGHAGATITIKVEWCGKKLSSGYGFSPRSLTSSRKFNARLNNFNKFAAQYLL
jgi:hypothetical protein